MIGAKAQTVTRLSLAGAQDKIPLILDDFGEVYLHQGVTPSSHILKFAEKPGLIFNELCMNTLAEFYDRLVERGLSELEWGKAQHIRRYITQQCTKTLKLLA